MSIDPEDDRDDEQKKIARMIIATGGRGSGKSAMLKQVMDAKAEKVGQRGIINPDFKPISSESLLRKATAASEIPEWKKGKYFPRRLPPIGWAFGDAFKMYKYQDQETGLVEWIWNSRDGIVPFIIRSKDGNELKHVDMWEDVYLPNWVPPVGARIFVDIPDFDEAKHQFNVRPVTVDITLHNIFLDFASFKPWRPDMMPRSFA